MDDRYFFGCLIYILIISFIGAILPTDFFVNDTPAAPDTYDSLDHIAATRYGHEFGENFSDITIFGQILTLLFFPIDIPDLNILLALIIMFINITTMVIPIIWIYDKIRGIGS